MKTIEELADIGANTLVSTPIHNLRARHLAFATAVRDAVMADTTQTEKDTAQTEKDNDSLRRTVDHQCVLRLDLQKQVTELQQKIEKLRETSQVQLAAICTRAGQNSRTSEGFIGKGHPYWTPAYDEVARAVEREMIHREKREVLKEDADRFKEISINLRRGMENQAKTIRRFQKEVADRDAVTSVAPSQHPTEHKESALAAVVAAARCIHHWYDFGEDGVVVSKDHVFKLWDALRSLGGQDEAVEAPLTPTGEQFLRDQFAMAALNGLLSGRPDADCGLKGYALDAYQFADAMLAAREVKL